MAKEKRILLNQIDHVGNNFDDLPDFEKIRHSRKNRNKRRSKSSPGKKFNRRSFQSS